MEKDCCKSLLHEIFHLWFISFLKKHYMISRPKTILHNQWRILYKKYAIDRLYDTVV